jgi:hypothetical protein|tara:strand:+ start:37067 stop:37255 length:189 start_codon:yes stop_codon:yes gene_type:complete
VQVGDLVQVLPAKVGYYIIVEDFAFHRDNDKAYWQLLPVTTSIYSGYGPMSEEFIEVVSESR